MQKKHTFMLEALTQVKLDPAALRTALKDMESTLGSVKLPEGANANIAKGFSKIKDELANYESLRSHAKTDSEWEEVLKSGNKVLKLYKTLRGQVENLGYISSKSLKNLFPDDVAENFKSAHSEVEKTKRAIQATTKEQKKAKDTVDEYDKALQEAYTELGRINDKKVIKTVSKEDYDKQKKAIEDLIAQRDTLEGKINATEAREGDKANAGGRITRWKTSLKQVNTELEEAQKAFQEITTKEERNNRILSLKNQISEIEPKLTEARNSLKEFENVDHIDKLKKSLNEILGIDMDSIPDSIEEITKLLNGLEDKKAEEVRAKLVELGTDLDSKVTPKVKELEKGIEEGADSLKKFGQTSGQIDSLKNSLLQFFSLTNGWALLKRGVQQAYQVIKELDDAMTEIAVVSDYTLDEIWKMRDDYTEAATELGAKTIDMVNAQKLYVQQGLDLIEATEVATETVKMARIANLDGAKATNLMTAAVRGFNMEMSEAARVNDVYSELAAKSAADTYEIATAMSKTASIAANANASFENTSAFLTQIIETTREAPETAGTALKTIIARFQELKKAPSEIGEVDGETVDANKIESALATAGVSLRNAQGEFRNFDEVILELSGKWNTLDVMTQRYIATMAAGSRQQSRFIALVSDNARLTELVGYAADSAGAANTQFEKTLDSLESKINKLKNAWGLFLQNLANNKVIKFVVDLLTRLLNVVNNTVGKIPGLAGSITQLLAAFVGFKGATKLIDKFFGHFGKVFIKQGEKAGTGFSKGFFNKADAGINKIKKLFQKETWIAPQVDTSSLDSLNKAKEAFEKTGAETTEQELLKAINDYSDALDVVGLKQGQYDELLKSGLTTQQLQVALSNKVVRQELLDAVAKGEVNDELKEKIALMKAESLWSQAGIIQKARAIIGILVFGHAIDEESDAYKKNIVVQMLKAKADTKSAAAQWLLNAAMYACPIFWIAAVILAVVAALAIFAAATESDAEKTERLNNALEQAAEIAKEAKEAFNEMSDGFAKLEEQTDLLDNLAEGTSAWRAQLAEVNSQITELIEQFPQLEQYLKIGDNGQLELDFTGSGTSLDAILKDAEHRAAKAQAISKNIEAELNLHQNTVSLEQIANLTTANARIAANTSVGMGTQQTLIKGDRVGELGFTTGNGVTEDFSDVYIGQADLLKQFSTGLITDYDDFLAYLQSKVLEDQMLTTTGGYGTALEAFYNSFAQASKKIFSRYNDLLKDQDTIVNSWATYSLSSESQAYKDNLSQIQKVLSNRAIYDSVQIENIDDAIENLGMNVLGLTADDVETRLPDDIKKEVYEQIMGSDTWDKLEEKPTDDWFIAYAEQLRTDVVIKEINDLLVDGDESILAIVNGDLNKINEDIKDKSINFDVLVSNKVIRQSIKDLQEEAKAQIAHIQNEMSSTFGFSAEMYTDLNTATLLLSANEASKSFADYSEALKQGYIEVVNAGKEGDAELQKFYQSLNTKSAIEYAKAVYSAQNSQSKALQLASKNFDLDLIAPQQLNELYNTLSENMKEMAQDGKVTAEEMYEVAKSNKTVQSVMETTGMTVSEIADYFQALNDGLISVNTTSTTFLTTLRKLNQASNMLEDSLLFLDNFEAEKGQTDVLSGLTDMFSGAKELYDKGAINDNTLHSYFKALTSDKFWNELTGTITEKMQRVYEVLGMEGEEFDIANLWTKLAEDSAIGDLINLEDGNLLIDVSNIDLLKEKLSKYGLSDDLIESLLSSVSGYDENNALETTSQIQALADLIANARELDGKTIIDENAFKIIAERMKVTVDDLKKQVEEQFEIEIELITPKNFEFRSLIFDDKELSGDEIAYMIDLGFNFDDIKQEVDSWLDENHQLSLVVNGELITDTIESAQIEAAYSEHVQKVKDAQTKKDGLVTQKTTAAAIVVGMTQGANEVIGEMLKQPIIGWLLRMAGVSSESKKINVQSITENIDALYADYEYEINQELEELKQYTPKNNTTTSSISYNDALAVLSKKLGKSVSTIKAKLADLEQDSGSGDNEDKEDIWEEDYDWLANQLAIQNKLIRERNKLEREYSRMQESQNSTIAEQVEARKQIEQMLLSENAALAVTKADREREMKALQSMFSDVSKYVWFNNATSTTQINESKMRNDLKSGKISTEFGDRIDQAYEEFERVREELERIDDDINENTDVIDEMRKEARDSYISLAERLTEAIVNDRQKQIDQMQDISDSISDANSVLLDKISTGLNDYRSDRDSAEELKNIEDMERRLAMMRTDTSGSNILDIMALEDELADARQSYMDNQIDRAIDMLSRDNELAQQQREEQIMLAEKQLEYDQENGKIAAQVDNLLKKLGGTDEQTVVDQITAMLKNSENWDSLIEAQKEVWKIELTSEISNAIRHILGIPNQDGDNPPSGGDTNSGGTGSDTGSSSETVTITKGTTATVVSGGRWHSTSNGGSSGYSSKDTAVTVNQVNPGAKYPYHVVNASGSALGWVAEDVFKFKTGGLADFTGPAWLDGTKSKPEYVLNAEQTQGFLTLVDVIGNLKGNIGETAGNNYYDVRIEVDEIANDYDVEQLMDKMKRIITDDANYRNVNAIDLGRR